MTQAEIDARIRSLEDMLAKETNPSTLATLNRCIEILIMRDPDE